MWLLLWLLTAAAVPHSATLLCLQHLNQTSHQMGLVMQTAARKGSKSGVFPA
jgi:hypothetical protein